MTLEEKAEEYIEKNCKIWEEGELTVDEIVRLAYLAGAKENGVVWHDLRKNPNDLPKGNNPVLVIIDYLALGKEYAIRENLKEDSKGLIAWCEIPTFDKE